MENRAMSIEKDGKEEIKIGQIDAEENSNTWPISNTSDLKTYTANIANGIEKPEPNYEGEENY